MTVFWRDQEVAARVRLHMPEESTIDLDEHAAHIGRTVAGAEVARIQTAEGRVALHALERQVASAFGAQP